MGSYFKKHLIKYIEKIDFDIDTKKCEGQTDFELYDYLVQNGLEKTKILSYFEDLFSLPFVDVSGLEEIVVDDSKKELSQILAQKDILLFKRADKLFLCIDNLSKVQTIKDLKIDFDYNLVFTYPFLLQYTLTLVSNSKNNASAVNENKLEPIKENWDVVSPTTGEVSRQGEFVETVVVATGDNSIDNAIKNYLGVNYKHNVLAVIEYKSQLKDYCIQNPPNIIIVGDNLGGKESLTAILIEIKNIIPTVRIIYLAGDVSEDPIRKQNCGVLVISGIYDIVTKNEFSTKNLKDIINNPGEKEKVFHMVSWVKDSTNNKKNNIKLFNENKTGVDKSLHQYHKKLFTFASPIGGVGKSFLLQQAAIAISRYAKKTQTSNLNVGIVDLDLSKFSTSNYFETLNNKKNIFNAIKACEEVIDKKGKHKDVGKNKELATIEKVISNFVESRIHRNIFVLGGSQEEYLKKNEGVLSSDIVTYIVECALDVFDIVFVDARTSFSTNIIYPLFALSEKAFLVIQPGHQVFTTVSRYQRYLKSNDIYFKYRMKYILNKDFGIEKHNLNINTIQKSLDIGIEHSLPYIKPDLLFMHSMKKNLIIHELQQNSDKLSFWSFVNSICPIEEIKGINYLEKKENEPARIKQSDTKGWLNTLTGVFTRYFNEKVEDV